MEWIADLADVLPAPDGLEVASRFAKRMPPGYFERTSLSDAAFDAEMVEALEKQPEAGRRAVSLHRDFIDEDLLGIDTSPSGGHYLLAVRPEETAAPGSFRLRCYGTADIDLSDLVPVLESFGLVVAEAMPTVFGADAPNGNAIYLNNIGLRIRIKHQAGLRFDPATDGERLVAALGAVAARNSEVDSLNRLVLGAGLQWPQVMVMRAYRRYCHQGGTQLTDTQLDDPLIEFPAVTRGLLHVFETRFDPTITSKDNVRAQARSQLAAELALVPDFRSHQVLRGYLGLIDATVRTNYYLPEITEPPISTLTLKFDSTVVPDLPMPRPAFESFVHSPRLEGIHLRSGRIARGGIRWSTRPVDFRTEVLGLVGAQTKKNAIIVPTGSKGGFVVRGADARPEEVAAAYQVFVRSLLEVTDNLIEGRVITPERVVAYDGPDPYLVVAADRGTATFSDLANAISIDRRFWLGDAFASGARTDLITRPWPSQPGGRGRSSVGTSGNWISMFKKNPSGWLVSVICRVMCLAMECSRARPLS